MRKLAPNQGAQQSPIRSRYSLNACSGVLWRAAQCRASLLLVTKQCVRRCVHVAAHAMRKHTLLCIKHLCKEVAPTSASKIKKPLQEALTFTLLHYVRPKYHALVGNNGLLGIGSSLLRAYSGLSSMAQYHVRGIPILNVK